jgi:hypothetical protein
MTLFAWLLGFVLPACGAPGAQGLPVPPPMDMAHIVRPANPNTALAAPAGFTPPPDLPTPVYPVPAARLYATVQKMAVAQPRTYVAASYPDRLQVHYVVRSAVFNFPDLVAVQVTPDGADSSLLVLYSRSIYGRSDLGVNRKRLEAWLASLQSALASSSER